MDVGRRRALYEVAREHDLIILEDDPYYFLQFDYENRLPSLMSMDVDERVLRFDSLSKVLSSGLRLGMVTGPDSLIHRIVLSMQGTCLHTSGVSQAMTLALFDHWSNEDGKGGFEAHARSVADFYKYQRDAFMQSAEKHLDGLAEWGTPDAGMFAWIKLLGVTDSKSLIYERAVKANVLLVPGVEFDPQRKGSPYVRASFSTATPEQMDVALERFASVLKEQQT